jgi:hypothetical protein
MSGHGQKAKRRRVPPEAGRRRPELVGSTTAATRLTPRRNPLIDAVRGLAVVLMVLDHVLFQRDPSSVLRVGSPVSITRLSLPLFMLAAAAVWRPGAWRRYGRLIPVAVVELVLCELLGMPAPGIVALIVVVGLVLDVAAWLRAGREVHPYVWALLGLVQALYVPVAWGGYQPGLVLAWWALGRLAWPTLEAAASSVTSSSTLRNWLASIGRRPLVWYVGHLLVLVVVVEVL